MSSLLCCYTLYGLNLRFTDPDILSDSDDALFFEMSFRLIKNVLNPRFHINVMDVVSEYRTLLSKPVLDQNASIASVQVLFKLFRTLLRSVYSKRVLGLSLV